MKGVSHPKNDASLNASVNESIHDIIERVDTSRRRFMQTSIGAATLTVAGGVTLGGLMQTVEAHGANDHGAMKYPGIGFAGVPAGRAPLLDRVTVPAGYTAELLVAWGDPIMAGGRPFRGDASETALDQLRQFGAHCDALHFFPLVAGSGPAASAAGLLAVNNEYTQEALLYPDGQQGAGYTIQKTRKSQAAHGASIVEIRKERDKGDKNSRYRKGGRQENWTVQTRSRYGRRITGNTPMFFAGPAAGHALMQTREFQITGSGSFATGGMTSGFRGFGTLNNCGHGVTPWGTFLTGEENWNGYFGSTTAVDTSASTEIGTSRAASTDKR